MTQQGTWKAAAKVEEEAVLDIACSTVEDTIRDHQREIKDLQDESSRLFGDPERLPDYIDLRGRISHLKKETKELEQWMQSLYFGRVDFQHEGEVNPSTYYIGKIPSNVRKARENCEKSGIMLVDWRAPVAELYYSRDNSYAVNGEKRQGKLHLVRHLRVSGRNLIDLADIVTENVHFVDPFLVQNLNRYGRSRFVDIVRTVQPEQNRLVRYPADKHLIIQGGAGSGKTVVLLHRIAYLVYATKCDPADILVLTPSRLLLEQLSDTLPDLHVQNVSQMTLEEFFWQVAGKPGKHAGIRPTQFATWYLLPESKKIIAKWVSFAYGSNFSQLADLLIYKARQRVYQAITDLTNGGEILIDARRIRDFLDREAIRDLPYNKQITHLKEWLRMVTTASEKIVKRYVDNLPSPEDLYWNTVVPSYAGYKSTCCYHLLPGKEASSVPEWIIDDLASLLYLYVRLNGVNKKYRFIFVDEAHKLSSLWLVVLRKFLAPGGSFTLAGDAYQLSGSTCRKDWEWACEALGFDNVFVETLTIAYRATKEIIEKASSILKTIAPEIALSGVRPEGEPIRYAKDVKEFLDFVTENKEIKTAGIICPTEERVEEVKESLKKQEQCEKQIMVVSVEEAGGLEFDAVMVDQADFYDCADVDHARALYTAVSRAVHYLYLTP